MNRAHHVLLLLVALTVTVLAQNENSLTRDEVAIIKRKLVAVTEALGEPPPGYAKTEESFSLPTEANKAESAGRFHPVYGSASLKFGSAAEKKGKKSGEDLQKEYQKKITDAQAKGDYQSMAQLSQEMMQKVSKASAEAMEGPSEPVGVAITFNSNPSQTIDPDAVVLEAPGVIALKFKEDVDGTKGRVVLYFDPVNLKSTKTLSVVQMNEPEGGVTKKNAVKNVIVELNGPLGEIQTWAKRIAAKKVLAQID